MGNKLTPKVILEGTRLTFKAEIALGLNEHPRIVGPRQYRYHSLLISAEPDAALQPGVRFPLAGGKAAAAEFPNRVLHSLRR
jgi:hypothetical protein